MNEPKNHHFVSRCQVNNFFNTKEKTIFLYDKEKDFYFSSKSSKNIFSELFSNSKINEGKIDHKGLERDLQLNFENYFPSIKELITNFETNIFLKKKETISALYRLTLYGLIGEMRNPNYKVETEKTIRNTFDEIHRDVPVEFVSEYQNYVLETRKTKHPNRLIYSETALSFLEKMGDLDFKIFQINSNDVFLLPDVCAITFREKINQYFNPDVYEKAIVGIPLTDKIYIEAASKKFGNTATQLIKINADNKNIVKLINKEIYNQAYKTIATSDQNRLMDMVKNIKTNM